MQFCTVIFDMDGLLFDTERLFLEHAGAVEKEIGYDVPFEVHLEAIGRTFEDIGRLYREQVSPDFPMDFFMKKTKNRMFQYIKEKGMPIKPGVRELLQRLRQDSIPLVLASSSHREIIDFYMEVSGFGEFFDHLVSGDDVAAGKPAPDIFLRAAELAGCDPADCLVLEDSNNGIRAAHAAGMTAVMVPDVKEAEEDVREMYLTSLSEIGAILDLILD